jgi:hypothetical protein
MQTSEMKRTKKTASKKTETQRKKRMKAKLAFVPLAVSKSTWALPYA